MSKKVILSFTVFLFLLNIVCWKEVFDLNKIKLLEVDFLDVGQGDSVFIKTPENHQIIIDGGPDSSVLGKIENRIPFWDREIDLVILTHPELDHVEGILDLLQTYKADYILWSGVKKDTSEYNIWVATIERQKLMGAKIITAKPSQEIKAGNIIIKTLYPLENVEGKIVKNTSNDTCVVVKVIYGANSFIFTGDIGVTEEKELVNSGIDLESDVLKVAHHGSKYSTSDLFLQNVSPDIAVIEVGKNSYGHPTSEVLQRLEKSGIKMFRTDKDGDVEFVSNGNNIIKISN